MATFPRAPIGADVELNLGTWTSIVSPTPYVYQRDPITITSGRPDQNSTVNPASCTLTLKDKDGRFSFTNPLGAYYPNLVHNTPLRASLPNSLLPAPYSTTYLRMEDDAVSYASCPAVAQLELTGSLDVRADLDLSGYGYMPIVSIWNASASVNQRSWWFGLLADGTLAFSYTTDGTAATWKLASPGTIPNSTLPIPLGRLCVRAVFNASAGTVAFYTAPPGSTTSSTAWTQLGPTVTGLGAVTMFASASAPLTVGYSAGLAYDWLNSFITQGTDTIGIGRVLSTEGGLIAPQGAVYDAALYNASAVLVAHPSFNTQTAGATSWTDGQSNAWTVSGTATLNNRSYRFHGELAELPKAADPTATDVYSQATAAGVLRRLGQGNSPLNSPMYRANVRLTGTAAPAAYWPCEDGTNATQLASALAGGSPMTVSGKPSLGTNTNFVCSAGLPTLNGSTWTGAVTSQTFQWAGSIGTPLTRQWNGNYVRFLLQVPSGGDTNNGTIISVYTTGTVARLDLVYVTTSGGGFTVNCYNAAGTNIATIAPFQLINSPDGILGYTVAGNGALVEMELQLTISGSTITVTVIPLLVGSSTYGATSTTITSASMGAVTKVAVNPQGALTGTTVGHITVQADSTLAASYTLIPALNAWLGETAGDRVRRLCAEEGVQSRIYGHSDRSVFMGYQTIKSLSALLQECESTDRGLLYEPASALAVGYRTNTSLCNQTAKATASYGSSQLDKAFGSTSDDFLSLNDVTATNPDGSSGRQYLASGAMSIQAPPNGIGRIDTTVPVNAGWDTQLASIAGWVLNASIDPRDRLPAIPFNMARSETPAAVALLRAGDRLTIPDPPSWIQYDPIEQIAAGFTETFGPAAIWQINVNGIPYYPYTVAEATGGTSPAVHVDTDGSTLTSTVTSAATGLSFTTTNSAYMPVWTSDPSMFPFDVAIGGERITVAGPGTCLGIDPFLSQGAAQYTGQNAGLAFDTSIPWNVDGAQDGAYSTGALLLTPVGSPATYADVIGVTTAAGSIAVNTSYKIWGWVYATQSRSYQLFVNWMLNGVYVSTSLATGVTVPAGAWTFVSGTVTSPASGVNNCGFGVSDQGSPTTAMTFRAWGLNMASASTITATSPQAVTGIRGVNGVVKAQSAGTDVRLWYPPIAGLGQ